MKSSIVSRPGRAPSAAALVALLCACASLLVLFTPSPAAAQPASSADASGSSIRGSLLTPESWGGNGATVHVVIAENGSQTTADSNGRYVFSEVAPGTYTVLATGRGLAPLRIAGVVVSPHATTTVDLRQMELSNGSDEAAQGGEIKSLDKFIVSEAPVQRFANGNVDFPRGINDAQPYYIFKQTDLEDSGAVNVEEFLKEKLSMDNTAQSNTDLFSAGIGTSSSINLRGLGVGQTLVLINGRRIQGVDQLSANTYGSQPDVNAIPQSAVERIEVLPSSASGIYGANAAGGVINVILKKDYNGSEIKYTYGNTFDADAPTERISLSYGASKGKTRVMVSATYYDQKPLLVQDRPQLTIRGIDTILRNNPILIQPSGIPYSGGGTNIALSPAASNGYTNPQTATLTFKDGTSLNSLFTYVPAGISPTTAAATLQAGLRADAGSYNYNLDPADGKQGELGQISAVPRQKSFMASITQQLTPNIEWFEEFMSGSNTGLSLYNHIASSTTSAAEYVVPGNAPDNPFQENVLVKFPLLSQSPLQTFSQTYSLSSGFDVKLPFNWYGEFDYTWSTNAHSYTLHIEDNTALNPLFFNGTINPFVDTAQYHLNLSPYLSNYRFQGTSDLNDVAVRGSGPVYHLPWGAPTMSFGAERRLTGQHNATVNSLVPIAPADSATVLYFGQKTVTTSLYGETWVPLITKKNARFLLNAVDIQVAVRAEKAIAGTGSPNATSSGGKAFVIAAPTAPGGGLLSSRVTYTSTDPTLALRYSPTEDILFRASYSTAFIPPSNTQLQSNPNRPTVTIVDPQTGTTYGTLVISGGSPNLLPQTTKDWDAGIVWAPQKGALKGFRINLEYFYIKETNVISSLTPQVILNNPIYASHVTRSPTTGLVTLIDTSLMNLAYFYTNGFDLSLAYRKPTPIGTLSLSGMGTVVDHYKNELQPGTPELEYVGYPSFGGPVKYRANATFSWEKNGLRLGWTTRFFSSYGQYGAPGSPYYSTPGLALYTLYTKAQGSDTVPSQLYHDVFAAYSFSDSSRFSYLSGLSLQATVMNVFNSVPPFDAYYTPNFYSPFASYRLREYQVSVRKAF